MSARLGGLGIHARDALRRTLTQAMQAAGARRPASADLDRIMAYGIDQIEHAMQMDAISAERRAQDPHA